jgi:hypothetical protein
MPSRHRGPIAVAALAFLVAAPSLALADAPSDDASPQRVQADAEFAEGKQLLDAGQIAAACARFAKSQDLDPKLGRLLNLAFCHEQEGKTTSAWNEYNAAAALAAQKGQPDRVDFAREHAASIAKRLSFLHLDVPAGVETIEVDGAGVPRDRWATPLPLDPGDHKITAAAAGKKAASVAVTVSPVPGVQELAIPPLEADRAAAPVAASPGAGAPPAGDTEQAHHASRAPAYVATGVAVVGLGVGVAGGLVAMSKKNQADAQCPQKLCNMAGRALVSDAQTSATLSTVGFGVGLAGAAAAVWFFLHAASSDSGAAQLTPVIGPRAASLGLEGTW